MSKPELFALNGLRFFAACWILAFHARLHFGDFGGSIVSSFSRHGTLAMSLFFSLSGFVLAYRYDRFSSVDDIRRFAIARIARLYPTYLFVGVVTLWQIPEHRAAWAAAVAVPLFLLALQAWAPWLFNFWNFNGSWSLSVEAFFYSLFPWLRRRLNGFRDGSLQAVFWTVPPIMLAMFVASAWIQSSTEVDALLWCYVLPACRLPEFIAGVTAYVLFVERAANRRRLAAVSLAGTVAVGVAILAVDDLPGMIEWNWLAIVPFVGAFVYLSRCSAPSFVRAICNYCGRLSYAVYMAQFVTIPLLQRDLSEGSSGPLAVAAICLTLALSVVLYHAVEVPGHRLLLGKKLAQSPRIVRGS